MPDEPTDTRQPEAMDMKLQADAGVRWENPDAPTRDQMIRINALNGALSIRAATFNSTASMEALLADADRIAAWITTGKVPTKDAVDAH